MRTHHVMQVSEPLRHTTKKAFDLAVASYHRIRGVRASRSVVPQPLAAPPRPQIPRPLTRVQARLMHTQHTDTHAHTRSRAILCPQAKSNRIVAMVIEDPRKDRELDLVPDVRNKLPELQLH